LQARVNGDLALDFGDVALTSYAGLELFARYLRRTGFNAVVREVFRGTSTWGDYGVVAMVRLLIGLLVVGGRRLRHVAYVADDPVFRRFTGLRRVPTARTISRWLKAFTMTTVGRLQDLNARVVARVLAALGLGTMTIDVDGVVVSTGLQVERAFRGFNPHHRKVPSYYPILAHVAGKRPAFPCFLMRASERCSCSPAGGRGGVTNAQEPRAGGAGRSVVLA
jgi:hypothetical protein